ncbi:S-methyl-5-thioribose kinase [Oceanisphaera arctica]|uniref:S-methyl-5-thioribose kinase n=1 Tax=Oceanisphaera arctica TaxID=641510 RepID=A0A2P5TIK9_9GAMM|nr:S-methyl-5-thioribose kinase [Oceanisphaera arctica]PPL14618.1 S-methyl-5-thioribose kinase [Oceanisphaera arctica]GHA10062.1 methylthioribose kinase [Oceanisphaera arctica]
MSQYRIFKVEDAIAYVREAAGQGGEVPLQGEEIGDGNLNQVFRVWKPGESRGFIVKQALPYIRCIGESWPLTRDRARIEAQILLRHGSVCPEYTVEVLHHDPELSVMLLEDLSDHQVWRQALLEDASFPEAAAQLGRYLARVHYHSSAFHLDYQAQQAAQIAFANPELMAITEEVFFVDPFRDHERNNVEPLIRAEAEQQWADAALKVKVATLKHDFRCKGEALLHGDLHTGSVMVAAGKLKVIDAEFGGYGPMGFDLGVIFANLLLNFCSQPGRHPADAGQRYQHRRIEEILTLWRSFKADFVTLEAKSPDPALAEPGYVQAFMRRVWRDALGYAGCEMVRRTIGIAHVVDLDGIEDPDRRAPCQRQALALGRTLVMEAEQLDEEQLRVLLLEWVS